VKKLTWLFKQKEKKLFASTLLHFPHQPPMVLDDSAVSHCWGLPPWLATAVFVFICLLFWVFFVVFLSSCLPMFWCLVLVIHYTCQITFIGNPDYMASVPRAKRPIYSEALLPRTYILSLNFGLPRPCCFFFFFFF
jgi:hypothetical protein